MFPIKSIKILLLFFTLVVFKSPAKACMEENITDTAQNSLVFKKNNSDKTILLESGTEIKLWLREGEPVEGEFKSLYQDTLILFGNGIHKKFSTKDIEKIKIFSPISGRIAGGVFMVVGASAMALGGITLIVGTAALFKDNIGVIVLIATPILVGVGYGLYHIGKIISGKKINLQSKWSIDLRKQ